MSNVTPLSDESGRSPRRGWFSLNVGTALALAVVLSLLAFVLTSNPASVESSDSDATELEAAEATDPAPLSAPAEPVETDNEPDTDRETAAIERPAAEAATVARDGGGDTAFSAASHAVVSMAGDITNMGATEIGLVTHFPASQFVWDRVDISAEGSFDVSWLGELDGKLVAVGSSWDESDGSNRLITVSSADGLTWTEVGTFALPEGSWVSRIAGDGVDKVFAFAESWDESVGSTSHKL